MRETFADILKNCEQKLFVPCKICHAPTLDFGEGNAVCKEHQSEIYVYVDQLEEGNHCVLTIRYM